ncbi:endonuclease/exonuclease/phosphatase family protein [Phycicoccus sp. CSK15P-2]|uniref:endonuclease/exonuclease/phosphatase family protein n=1 Tax=Phycicoccus sp. CSK15P-2 TaxID=2807627 RepID=UPI001950B053|nr:endonuclease/exonuclease/phosphatase family protein [Phycicoccus sp. CSK15P-2]MBM6405425.1 endonuclease/exonuclease/phosphatase family protein [Phycicoccus sp. CSK15P-2]
MAGTTRTRRTVLAALATALAGTALATGAPAASAADPQRVRIVTANVNFGADPDLVMERFAKYSQRADVVLVQEAKNVDFARALRGDDRWVVRQDTTSDAKQGSAVIVRRSIVAAASDIGPLRLTLGTPDVGGACGILARYVAHVRVELKNGGVIRPASLHLPPPRCQTGADGPYERMVRNVKQLSDSHPKRLVLGGDWNKVVRSDPNDLSARTGGRIVPRAPEGSIDGFYKPKGLGMAQPASTVGFASKGHQATQMIVLVPPTF